LPKAGLAATLTHQVLAGNDPNRPQSCRSEFTGTHPHRVEVAEVWKVSG